MDILIFLLIAALAGVLGTIGQFMVSIFGGFGEAILPFV